jgi:hypothetical protein
MLYIRVFLKGQDRLRPPLPLHIDIDGSHVSMKIVRDFAIQSDYGFGRRAGSGEILDSRYWFAGIDQILLSMGIEPGNIHDALFPGYGAM